MTEASAATEQTPIRVGPAGWSYPDWEGPVYPRPHPGAFHPLVFVARYFDCVELNSSFYALPSARNAERWVRLVDDRPRFLFLAKLYRGFTHEAGRELPRHEARAFAEGLGPLQEAGRLAALLAQFPVSFGAGEAAWARLGRIAEAFAEVPVVLEVRHRSFFSPEAVSRIEDLGLSLAWLDLPPARDHPPHGHPTPGPVGYARLHGRNAAAWFDRGAGRDQRYDWLYGRDDLERIAGRVREIAAGGRQTFLITNNHYGGKAVANALELKGLVEGRAPLAPPTVVEAFPHLAGRVRVEGQQTLF